MKTLLKELESSLLEEITFDSKTNLLEVKFIHSDSIYAYKDVYAQDFEDLRQADSLGSYFAKNIRNGYEFEKIEVKDIPGFEGTLERLDNLTIQPSNEDK